jgi:uncharacterized protein
VLRRLVTGICNLGWRYYQSRVEVTALRLLLAPHQAEVIAFGVRRLNLFGSTARGDTPEDSDIDFLVEFEGPATFDRYMGLKLLLEDVLGHHVDLVTSKSLRPELRPYVERDLVQVV